MFKVLLFTLSLLLLNYNQTLTLVYGKPQDFEYCKQDWRILMGFVF
jgi:hypothetical protein